MLEYESTVKCVSVESEKRWKRRVSYGESYASMQSNDKTGK
jgi:hypothetical protein